MKYVLILIIRSYWILVPESKRRKCIFRKSCSQFVYEEALHGFLKGLNAFRYRYRNCRYGYEIFENPLDNTFQMILPSGQIIKEIDISERLTVEKNKNEKILRK